MKPQTTLYQAIYDSINDNIENGSLKPGDRIASELELSQSFGVSRITARHALEMLAAENKIYRLPGKGSFVGTSNRGIFATADQDATGLVGIIMPDFSATFGTRLLRSLEIQCARYGYLPVLICTHGHQDVEDASIERLVRKGIQGLIVMPVHGEHYSHNMLKLVVEGFPIVAIDRYLQGLPAPFVGSDNIKAVRDTVRHLKNEGHKHIGIVSPLPKDTSTIKDRIAGYEQGMKEAGLTWEPGYCLSDLLSMIPGNDDPDKHETDLKKIRSYLEKNPQITAVITIEYAIALMLQQVTTSNPTPRELTVISFDGTEDMERWTGIGQLRQKEEEIGTKAVDLLKQLIDGKPTTEKVLLSVDLFPVPGG